MPEATQVMFGYKEIVELLIRKAGIKEGHWQLSINFAFTATTLGPSEEDLKPGIIVAVNAIGIAKVETPTNLSVDAATVWNSPETTGAT